MFLGMYNERACLPLLQLEQVEHQIPLLDIYSILTFKFFLDCDLLNGDASFRWSFRPNSAWGSIESTTILTTHPSLLLTVKKL